MELCRRVRPGEDQGPYSVTIRFRSDGPEGLNGARERIPCPSVETARPQFTPDGSEDTRGPTGDLVFPEGSRGLVLPPTRSRGVEVGGQGSSE